MSRTKRRANALRLGMVQTSVIILECAFTHTDSESRCESATGGSMERERRTLMDWFLIAFVVSLGSWAATLIVLLSGFYLYSYHLNKAVETAAKAMNDSFERSMESARPRTTTERIPPGSREECLAETGGVANEAYQRCRTGYTRTLRH
jgi:hypothetical protein